MDGEDPFMRLPEGCISLILSFTSARDVCRSAAVSLAFRSASESDVVWDRLLPPDYMEIVSKSVSPIEFTSKKDLYFRLCDPILIEHGKLSYWIDKSSGKKFYMLSPRELTIIWSDTPTYWKWVSLPESRFNEVAELLSVCWLEIRGRIHVHMLSPQTAYKVYFVYKIKDGSYGLEFPPAGTSVKLGGQESSHNVYLDLQSGPPHSPRMWNAFERLNMWRRAQAVRSSIEGQVPKDRSDGWKEIELGDFFNEEGEEGDVEMSLMEVKSGHWKRGLVIEGIEIRPA